MSQTAAIVRICAKDPIGARRTSDTWVRHHWLVLESDQTTAS